MATNQEATEICNPLEIIDKLLLGAAPATKGGDDDAKDDDTCPVRVHFREFLDRSTHHIPLLNRTNARQLKSNTLVRFRCMITNQYEPEYYCKKLMAVDKKTNTIKSIPCSYRDGLEYLPKNIEIMPFQSRNSESAQMELDHAHAVPDAGRARVHAVPIPGESGWQKGAEHGKVAASSSAQDDCADMDQAQNAFAAAVQEQQEADPETQEFILKLYQHKDPCRSDEFKVAETYDVVGVLTHAPAWIEAAKPKSNVTWNTGDSAGAKVTQHDAFVQAMAAEDRKPFDGIPSIHVVHYSKLSPNCGIIPDPSDTELFKSKWDDLRSKNATHREGILNYITSAVGGDKLVAEYLLANMVSCVYARMHGHVFGKLPLVLTNCPKSDPANANSWAHKLLKLYQQLLPRAVLIHMSLAQLNAERLVPVRDHSTAMLSRGRLQVANHTPMIIDETSMEEGQLVDHGVRNLKALQDLIGTQNVKYDFKFHELPFATDAPTVVLAENMSLLCKGPIRTQVHTLKLDISSLPKLPEVPAETLQTWRDYMAMVLAVDDAFGSHTQEVLQAAQDGFTSAREQNPKTGEWWLHNRMVFSRILARTYLETEVNIERWNHAIGLENKRESSLKPLEDTPSRAAEAS